MKKITLLMALMITSLGFSQTYLPLTFTNANQLMTGSDLSVATLVPDPLDITNQVMQIVGDPAQQYDTASLVLSTPLNLEDNANNTITFRINPIGITGTRDHILKFQNPGGVELHFTTTDSGWQNITVNFGSGLVAYSTILIFTDDGTNNAGTYLVDDIAGATNNPLSILTLPLRFSATNELFAGDGSVTTSLVADPLDALNKVMKVEDLVGGEWSNALLHLNPSVNLSDNANNTITFRINPIGVTGVHHHLLKFQDAGAAEYWFDTTGSGWQTITANFGPGLGSYPTIVIMPDAGSLDTGTYLIDDIEFASQVLLNAEDGTTNKLATMNVFANNALLQSNADMIVVANPNVSGINTSTKCIQFTRRTSGTDAMPWAGFWCPVTDPDPDFTTNKFVHVKIMKSNTSPVKFKIEGGPTGTVEIYSINSYTTPGVWQDMVFDFSDRSGVYPIVALMPDFEDPLIASGDRIIYFDDIIVNNIATPEVLGVQKNTLSVKIAMYPNPTNGVLNIQSSEELSSATIYSFEGRKVMTINKFESNNTKINASSLSNGVYLIDFTAKSGASQTQKFIKE